MFINLHYILCRRNYEKKHIYFNVRVYIRVMVVCSNIYRVDVLLFGCEVSKLVFQCKIKIKKKKCIP